MLGFQGNGPLYPMKHFLHKALQYENRVQGLVYDINGEIAVVLASPNWHHYPPLIPPITPHGRTSCTECYSQ